MAVEPREFDSVIHLVPVVPVTSKTGTRYSNEPIPIRQSGLEEIFLEDVDGRRYMKYEIYESQVARWEPKTRQSSSFVFLKASVKALFVSLSLSLYRSNLLLLLVVSVTVKRID